MKKHTLFLKDGLKRALQTTCGLSLLLAASMFNGCASWPTEGPSGTLTITGIPAEYEGKFVKASLFLPLEKKEGKLFISPPKEISRAPVAAISNGQLTLSLYGEEAGYFGSDTANVCLRIGDTAEKAGGRYGNAGFDFIFADVPFADGVKTVKWDDQITHGFVTLTNFPAGFLYTNEERGIRIINTDNTVKMGGATVYIRHPDQELKVTRVPLGGALAGGGPLLQAPRQPVT
jgi:hypothetical protein